MGKRPEYHYQRTWYGRLWDEFNNKIARDEDRMRTWAWACDIALAG